MAAREARGRPSGGLPDWNDLALPLPRDTANRIADVSRRPSDADNVGLWLDKLVYRRRNGWTLEKEDRTFALGQLCRRYRSAAGAAAAARARETVAQIQPDGGLRLRVQATVNGRLLVDYGRANAIETSVSFHPIWGVPRIPSSALKGVTLAELRTDGWLPADLDTIFGTQDPTAIRRAAGQVVFHDALPAEGEFELALDVLTPHHREYYGQKAPPGEWESPVPHTFITVVKTTFELHVIALPRGGRDGRQDLALVREGLERALTDGGVGAKTAAGYGRFKEIRWGNP